ncbi:hypothetical protein T440DRAFT_462756 [Plenodomus tracheiphilus IPT5]|uniref:Exosome complex protein n=1 Tax=Plenodomus tracheiphilus IPT5 TaxID=1408161 RepID=A0A6A7BMD1_9PLEO|nr:hypothetical protein T440DRAFT_462756 [Plenodomus tracheiphilus IPT5]
MDPQTDLPALVEDLEVNIDELTATLAPLLSSPLSKTASSLPLLDKSKLYVLAAYSIESLLFSTLQASGINAKEHAIFPELARLKGYFGKIKEIEDRGVKGSAEGRARLDVGAAQRFIKHGLSGNERYDLERRERIAKEEARAAIKARQINKKFDEEGKTVDESQDVTPKKRGVEDIASAEDSAADEEILEGLEELPTAQHASKKPRVSAADLMDVDNDEAQSVSSHDHSSTSTSNNKKDKSRNKPSKKSTSQTDANPTTSPSANPEPPKKKRGRPKKSALHDSSPAQTQEQDTTPSTTRKSRRHNPRAFDEDKSEEAILPSQQAGEAPKTRSAAFDALVSGEGGGGKEKEKVGKGKGRGKGKGKGKGE